LTRAASLRSPPLNWRGAWKEEKGCDRQTDSPPNVPHSDIRPKSGQIRPSLLEAVRGIHKMLMTSLLSHFAPNLAKNFGGAILRFVLENSKTDS